MLCATICRMQKELGEAMIANLDNAKHYAGPIVTTVEPLKGFYHTEAHHQNYVACHL